MRILFTFLFIIGISAFSRAQILSDNAKISLITCDKGSELYSLFGHSALRLQDPNYKMDVIYNYGVFEFGESEFDFAMKFARGRLKYMLAIENFEDFLVVYDFEHRGVREQVLRLSQPQKQKIFGLLQENYLPENRYYQYDFFFDNCATRIRDILETALGDELVWHKHPDADQFTFRQIIDKDLVVQPWSDYGIDLALGSKIDVKATNADLMFLPEYVEEIFAESTIGGKPLVVQNEVVRSYELSEEKGSSWKTPAFLFWSLLVLAIVLSFLEWNKAVWFFDALFFKLMAWAGVLVLLLWFATDHTATKMNYNLIWANPIHFIILLSLARKRLQPKLNKIYLALTVLYFGLFFLWFILPQDFHPASKPLILILAIRYYYWFRNTKPAISAA